MIENRRAKFASIEGLEREDLPLAAEIWLDDVVRSTWATREAMKLAAHLVRYMATPDPATLTMTAIESQISLGREDVRRALMLMHTMLAVEAFAMDRETIRVALNLSLLQRLKALESRRRLDELMWHQRGIAPSTRTRVPPWLPEPVNEDHIGDDVEHASVTGIAAA